MSNLANVIKNIDPPIELTQSQYDALSSEQKNNGTIYYVTDSLDASQVITDDSNVQEAFDSLNPKIDKIISGETQIYSSQYFEAPSIHGIYTDQYGNFRPKSTASDTAYWSMRTYDQSFRPFQVYFSQGTIKNGGKILVYGKGDTYNSVYRTCGYLTSSGTRLVFSIPIRVSPLVTSATITDISGFYLHNLVGGYAYMKYGTNAASTAYLSNAQIWKNSAQAYSNSISSMTATIRSATGHLWIDIIFTNRLVTTSAASTNVTNNMPITFQGTFKISFQ